MNVAVKAPKITPEEFARRPDADDYELVDGMLVEREMSNETQQVGLSIYRLLASYADDSGGWALGDGITFCCFPLLPDRVRKPDASWFSPQRWSPRLLATSHIEIAPDLVVEVLSPNDGAYEVDVKIDEFLSAGTREVWIVHPAVRRIERRFADGTARWYEADETVDGNPMMPGFTLRLADVLLNLS